MTTSNIQKFIFESLPVKGAMVILDDSWETIANQREYPLGLKQLIAELLAANVLLTGNLKLDGKVICQLQDNPYFNLVVTECTNDLNIRATAKWDQDGALNLSYSDYLTKGRLIVSIDSKADGNLYQSIIALNSNIVADILNNYMAQSEQLKTWFLIAYNGNKVVGFMLQQLPDVNFEFNDKIERIFMLAETLTTRELLADNLEKIIYKLFHEDNVVLMPEQAVRFACSCSRERVSEILRSLGKEELESLVAEQDGIVVDCDYCNQKYKYTKHELIDIIMQMSFNEITPVSNQVH